MVTDRTRQVFDQLLDAEVAALPEHVAAWLEEVPLIVEDEPSPAMLEAMGMADEDDADLCGLHWGTALPDRASESLADLPDRMMLFRGPIMRLADYPGRRGSLSELKRQIRITLLHEIGHHFGLDEDDLDELGYG